MPSILFICSANRFRSVIAAEYFRHLAKQAGTLTEWEISSAGTWAINGLSPMLDAVQFTKEKGVEISHVRSREVNQEILDQADLVLVMGNGHLEALSYEFPSIEGRICLLSEACQEPAYDLPDLGEREDETPQDIANEICSLLRKGFKSISQKAIELEQKRKKINRSSY